MKKTLRLLGLMTILTACFELASCASRSEASTTPHLVARPASTSSTFERYYDVRTQNWEPADT